MDLAEMKNYFIQSLLLFLFLLSSPYPVRAILPADGNGDGLVDGHDIKTFAGALVYVRTGDTALRTKVKNAIMSALGTEKVGANNSILSLDRQLGGYVISAGFL